MPNYVAFPPGVRNPTANAPGAPGPFQKPTQPQQWGQIRDFDPPWQLNEERPVLQLDPEPRVPVVKSAILFVDIPDNMAGMFALRWRVRAGVAGGTTLFTFDAARLQQITLPAMTFVVSLRATAPGADHAYVSPTQRIKGGVFLADGTVASDAAVFTETFTVNAGLAQNMIPPPGAVRWRILGDRTAGASPYVAACIYAVVGAPGAFETYTGADLLALRPQWIPFPGIAYRVNIDNTLNLAGVQGAIQWAIDL